MHFNRTLVHGVEAVKVDAILRPNATTPLRESKLGSRGQVECILYAAGDSWHRVKRHAVQVYPSLSRHPLVANNMES